MTAVPNIILELRLEKEGTPVQNSWRLDGDESNAGAVLSFCPLLFEFRSLKAQRAWFPSAKASL
jgi:hypothetical protein